jgi:hypothetical protein
MQLLQQLFGLPANSRIRTCEILGGHRRELGAKTEAVAEPRRHDAHLCRDRLRGEPRALAAAEQSTCPTSPVQAARRR